MELVQSVFSLHSVRFGDVQHFIKLHSEGLRKLGISRLYPNYSGHQCNPKPYKAWLSIQQKTNIIIMMVIIS